jgi:hypothetical protein
VVVVVDVVVVNVVVKVVVVDVVAAAAVVAGDVAAVVESVLAKFDVTGVAIRVVDAISIRYFYNLSGQYNLLQILSVTTEDSDDSECRETIVRPEVVVSGSTGSVFVVSISASENKIRKSE